jgi:coenzyme F420-reducing hydrogenase gamma subunit
MTKFAVANFSAFGCQQSFMQLRTAVIQLHSNFGCGHSFFQIQSNLVKFLAHSDVLFWACIDNGWWTKICTTTAKYLTATGADS